MCGPQMWDGGPVGGEPCTGHEPAVYAASIAGFSRRGVTPSIAEVGYNIAAGDDGPMWLTRVADALEAGRVSARSEYSQNRGAGEREICRWSTSRRGPRPILHMYVRPYLRAGAGETVSFYRGVATGEGVVRRAGDGGVTEVVVPPRSFSDDFPELSLETGAEGARLLLLPR